MKKAIWGIAAIVMVMGLSTTALAHGGHGRGHGQTTAIAGYAPCTIDGCQVVHSHQHDGGWYCGEAGLKGEYERCGVDSCTETGLHEHNGAYYHCRDFYRGRAKGCHR